MTEIVPTEWEKHQLELKKLPKSSESAPEYLRRLLHMFVADFELSMQKRLDIVFWNKLKSLIDTMHKASEGDRIVDHNVQNLAIGFLTDLCLLVHEHFEVLEMGIPEVFTWHLPGAPRRTVKSKTKSKLFGAHFMLRMGDLMRYKDNFELAREYYETSIRITPIDGCAWNQMGILASSSAQFLESAYFHTRALHAPLDFSSATGNLNFIFKKFANRDASHPMPINETFLVVLAKLHFLLTVEKSEVVLAKLGEEVATSKEMIVLLMSAHQNLESGTYLETRALEYIHVIWTDAYRRLLDKILESRRPPDDLLHLAALLHSASEFSDDVKEDSERVGRLLQRDTTGNDVIEDPEGFQSFECSHNLEYPLRRSKLARILIGEKEKEGEDEEYEDEEEEVFSSESSPRATSSILKNKEEKGEKTVNRREYDSDSEEEILMRGRRRGRAQQLDSNDTDDEDF